MDEFEELRTIVRSENVLAEEIAVVIEDETGLEIGTAENALEVIRQIEERIEQTLYAISLLDEDLHIVPLRALQNLNENYHLPAICNAQDRLEQIQQNHIG